MQRMHARTHIYTHTEGNWVSRAQIYILWSVYYTPLISQNETTLTCLSCVWRLQIQLCWKPFQSLNYLLRTWILYQTNCNWYKTDLFRVSGQIVLQNLLDLLILIRTPVAWIYIMWYLVWNLCTSASSIPENFSGIFGTHMPVLSKIWRKIKLVQ